MPPLIPDGAHRIELPGYPERVGKVRHNFDLDTDHMLLVASDRISTFDAVHPTRIPDKGKILTQLSVFWFKMADALGIPHHLITADMNTIVEKYPTLEPHAPMLDGRSMLVRKGVVVPIEAIVRGHLAGSGWKDYQATGKVCGHVLRGGLKQCAQFDAPLFTPSTKEETGHDKNITFEVACDIAGEDVMEEMRDKTLQLFVATRAYAERQGIIIADTKLEWAHHKDIDELMLVDEVLTPDSSRFWPADKYAPGRDQESFDKQIVRNHVSATGWNKEPPAPELPPDIVRFTRDKYIEVYERLTGKKFAA